MHKDILSMSEMSNLAQLFCARVRHTPDKVGYEFFEQQTEQWRTLTWSQMADQVARWQAALKNENFSVGDRVALMVGNCPEWVMFEQAAIGLGLVVIPLYTNDRADNIQYIIDDAEVKLLFLESNEQYENLLPIFQSDSSLTRILIKTPGHQADDLVRHVGDWLPDDTRRYPLAELNVHKSTLMTIVYTSGTTGKPKGVMLSHENIMANVEGGLQHVDVFAEDSFLSFLPLSHMFERTVGHYLPICSGSVIIYARSIDQLAEDFISRKPTVLITVPRIFERVYNKIQAQLKEKPPFARWLFLNAIESGWKRFEYQQGRRSWCPQLLFNPLLHALVGRKVMAKLGGKMRLAISGGAPLSVDIARVFIGLGLPISQGYGLTESSPIISTNKLDDNDPASVGTPLCNVQVKLGENDELLVRSPSVMMGYWNNDEASRQCIDADGWLHTGDKARIKNDHIYITGRIKEIIVLSNGEKVPPADIEMAVANDTLIDQAMVIGEQKPYMTAVVVLNPDEWNKFAEKNRLEKEPEQLNSELVCTKLLDCIRSRMTDFPGYANIYKVFCTLEPWTVENGMITPTLKLKRNKILEKYQQQIDDMYEGH